MKALGLLLAAFTTTTPDPPHSSGKAGSGLGGWETALVVIGSVGAAVLVGYVVWWLVRRRGDPKSSSGQLVAVRSAFDRGDYRSVRRLERLKVESSAPQPPALQLLVGQAYANRGSDGRAADLIIKAIQELGNGQVQANVAALLLPEKRILREWLDRTAGATQISANDRANILQALTPFLSNPPIPLTDLLNVKFEVNTRTVKAQYLAKLYFLMNVAGGILAAGLAAATGALSAAQVKATVVVVVFAFLAATISALLTTVKPAEREQSARTKIDRLGNLATALTMFEINHPAAATPAAAAESAYERLAAADGISQVQPLP